jgi:hypothetical protein
VGVERGPLRLLSINCELLERKKERLQSIKLRLTAVGTKFRRQVAVAQSVYFAHGLRATELVF